MIDFEILDGAIELPEDRQDSRDILLGDIEGEVSLEDITKNVLAKYNQGNNIKTKTFCTHVNALKDICHLWNMDITEKMMDSLVVYAVSNGYKIGNGDYSETGMKRVCKRWNMNFANMLTRYLKLDIYNDTEFIMEALKLGHHLGVSYRGDELYGKDYRSDLVLNGVKFNGKQKYGHRTSIYMGTATYNKETNAIRVWDSYYGSKYNDYQLEHFIELYRNSTYRGNLYLFVKEQPVMTEAYKAKITNQINSLEIVEKTLSNNRGFAGILQDDYHVLAEKIRVEKKKAQDKIK